MALPRHPPESHGGNGRHRYADVEAVRVLADGPTGVAGLLRQAWERFGRPLAVTEAHLGCTREEQVRWLAEVWRECGRLRADGVDLRAVTAWSAFGAFDWDSLVTRDAGFYEPGLFDVRSAPPRPTALAGVVRQIAAGGEPTHPVLDSPGWWRRDDRLRHPPDGTDTRTGCPPTSAPAGAARPVLITGATGSLGRAFARVAAGRGLAIVLLGRQDLDIADPSSVAAALDAHQPWAVVNAAGYVRVDDAEADADRCRRENAVGPAVLAAACAARGVRLVTFSSDLVFDGRTDRPYREADPVAPLSVYGRTKAEAERLVLAAHPDALVVRTAAFFGPWDEHNFVRHAVRAVRAGGRFAAAADLTVTPTYVPDLTHAAFDLLTDGASGRWHLAGADPVTWADLAGGAVAAAGLDPAAVDPVPAARFGWAAPRPAYAALATGRGHPLPPLADGLARFVRESAA